MERVKMHPIIEFDEREEIGFYFEGEEYFGREGDTIASALMANGIREFRVTPKKKEGRGVFCGIGQCSDCMVEVDGVPNIKSCVTPLVSGMGIKKQR